MKLRKCRERLRGSEDKSRKIIFKKRVINLFGLCPLEGAMKPLIKDKGRSTLDSTNALVTCLVGAIIIN
ncbi:hypothetical protein OC709_02500 ['Planchonia careya' phytoplasma]|nr:hypothetical protein ['Planchonia careya' phytoplasma]